jgi:hypothetical protein
MKTNLQLMKISKFLVLALLTLSVATAWGQNGGFPGPISLNVGETASASKLTKFNLDFLGGSPRTLLRLLKSPPANL